ncbi:uncharacterized protein LOC143223736 [Tachypleus tridentatus]|uniref:uncharacterized protein LOC143223736 n=1 Tax=Tachypleus tridentatus TaxID=6853 RepID=UPI003FD1ABAF
MKFAIPRIWREPTDHSSNCYFFMVDLSKRLAEIHILPSLKCYRCSTYNTEGAGSVAPCYGYKETHLKICDLTDNYCMAMFHSVQRFSGQLG